MAVGGAQQGENLMALNLMQIVVRQASNMRHGFAPDARAFFIERGNKDLSMGLQAWRGYFQSVRPVLGKLLVNVDIVNSLVYRPGELTALAMSFLRLRDIRALERMSPVDLRHLKSFLKNINVTTTTSRVRRGRPIRDLVDNGGGYEFEKDGVRTTVQEHYRQVYNINLRYPAIFGVRIGRDAVIPAELCEVLPGQLYRKKIPAELGADFLKFATQKPDARIQAIQDAVSGRDEVFNYQGSDFVRDAGMRVDPAPLSITGRLLNPPRIQYGSGFEAIQSKRGAWNVVGKKFLTPSTIPTWGVILLDDRADPGRAEHFVGQLKRNLQALGVNVVRDPVLQRGGNAYQVSQALDTLLQRATIVSEPHPRTGQTKPIPPTIIIALLATNAAEIRRAVKHWGDVTRGIPTQCVRSGKWENAKDQYLNNVALKINAKIGGINSRVDDKSLVPPGTMVIGMDVGHPGPGVTARPSVTSLVASVNWDCTQYIAFCGVQPPRVEMIANLKQMLTGAVNQFVLRWEGKYPQKVVFFRDGVSEGEYEQVSQNEIQSIRNVLKDMIKIDPSGVELKSGEKAFGPGMPLPKITFIVVGKRHHVRFFPRNRNEADNSGNCPPGFVIDDQITNAKYPDYYLQSHSGIQGTSRPSHYIVLENELGLPPDTYQRLSFDLCHVYASATRSVSIPAPVYYADVRLFSLAN
ncbi:Piwi domain-containing protein [Rhodofomes roseus]|uniref:Piwi domain-containing protein n=1 Tax=Rhodofomes roseus TaxID=34475 RepID=A0ABQ8KWU7_9APHY|nr:Piwi domain-containing protein [Rhodofomes roseus]KAH9842843.1 Piwi domain-containing protein [Rhodofomes roseus]